MANTPNSIEMQIDNFLEQFKRSASKAMEGDWSTSASSSSGASMASSNGNGNVTKTVCFFNWIKLLLNTDVDEGNCGNNIILWYILHIANHSACMYVPTAARKSRKNFTPQYIRVESPCFPLSHLLSVLIIRRKKKSTSIVTLFVSIHSII